MIIEYFEPVMSSRDTACPEGRGAQSSGLHIQPDPNSIEQEGEVMSTAARQGTKFFLSPWFAPHDNIFM